MAAISALTQLEFLTANFKGGPPQRRTLNGREFLVAPITIFPPNGGVMNGSKGPLLYPAKICAKDIGAWNEVHLTGRHPTDANGKHISASSAGVLNQRIGFLRNDRIEGNKRRVDGYFDVEATKAYDTRNGTSILSDLQAGKLQEVSTGLVTYDSPATNGSSHNGKGYTYVVTGWKPDHLAILPDQRGACSVADGCGVNNSERDVDECILDEDCDEEDEDCIEECMFGTSNCGPDCECENCKEKKWEGEAEGEAQNFEGILANAGLYGNPQSLVSGKFKAHGAGTGKGESHESAQRGGMMISERERELGQDAQREFLETGSNPASWVTDEDKWEKAKAAADKGDYDEDNYYAVVTHIYKNMGGGIKGGTDNQSGSPLDDILNEGDFSMKLNEKQRKVIVTELTANCDCWKEGEDTLNEMSDERLLALAKSHKAATENVIIANAARSTFNIPTTLNAEEVPAFLQKKKAVVVPKEGDEAEGEETPPEEDMEKEDVVASAEARRIAANARHRKPQTAEQWLTDPSVPFEIREAARFAMNAERGQKAGIVQQLVANVEDDKRRERLAGRYMKMSLNDLQDELATRPYLTQNQRQEAENESLGFYFAGIGQPPTTNREADPELEAHVGLMQIPTLNFAELAGKRKTG